MKTAEEILNTYHPISRDHELKTDLWPTSTVIAAMEEFAAKPKWIDSSKILPEHDGAILVIGSHEVEKVWFDDELPESFKKSYRFWQPLPTTDLSL